MSISKIQPLLIIRIDLNKLYDNYYIIKRLVDNLHYTDFVLNSTYISEFKVHLTIDKNLKFNQKFVKQSIKRGYLKSKKVLKLSLEIWTLEDGEY